MHKPVYVDLLSGNGEASARQIAEQLTPEELARQLDSLKPRAFDLYALPPFLMWYAWRSRQMPRMARRIMFAAGLWSGLRNWRRYQELVSGQIQA